ncbi:MAG: hypothetical protein COV67_03655 [Nitrospinae bacterium CG11_big_fil_rev_8_21_14_0_20_56_8]|nr:MAG: hypothetical protein COV67_03655 [Nitrospinae bacterium CG11_big_fil_rev_8_21_14_0_20_56_8]
MPGSGKFDAILVAGEGESSYKVYHRHKAFLTLNGKCIINYVVEALQQVESINEIYIVGNTERLGPVLAEGGINREYPKKIHLAQQKKNLYENIWYTFLHSLPPDVDPLEIENSPCRDKAVLIVPCDAPLLTPHEVEYFINHCKVDRYDHILGLTPEERLEYFYPRDGKPGMKLAYLHLKEKSYRINNLHMVKPFHIINRAYIQKMYQYRYQRNFKNLVLFGLSLFGKDKIKNYQYYIGLELCLLCAAMGWTPLLEHFRKWIPKKGLEGCISHILKTRFVALEVPFAGATLDIDNDKDYETMKARFNEWREYVNHPAHFLSLGAA